MSISDINWLAVFVASLAFFGLGMIWYGPLFGKLWQRAIATDGGVALRQTNSARLLLAGFVMSMIIAVGMAIFLHGPDGHHQFDGAYGGLIGLMVGVLFILPTTVMNYIFARRSLALILIDGFYHIAANTLTGIILGAWH